MDKAPAYRDRLPTPILPAGEAELSRFRPDRTRYIRDHLTMVAAGGLVVVPVLWILSRGDHIWAGIFGVMGAMLIRGLWFYRDVMAMQWLLTDRALIAPGQDRFELSDITVLRRLMGDVQIITRGGRKTLLKHMADPEAVIAQIRAAR